MTDIIQDAKQLLGGTTPGPWIAADSDIIAPDNVFIGTISEYSGLIDGSEERDNAHLAAAAPELAKALAEETWEYSAQYRNDYTNGWKFLEELQGRWCTRETLALWVEGNLHRFYDNIRIVRRRVSPVEVCCQS